MQLCISIIYLTRPLEPSLPDVFVSTLSSSAGMTSQLPNLYCVMPFQPKFSSKD